LGIFPRSHPIIAKIPNHKQSVTLKMDKSKINSHHKEKVTQDAQKNNVYPHRLSPGGYDRLKRIMIFEASSSVPNDESSLSLITPPLRHKKWSRARKKLSGDYTSEETRIIVERIVSNS